MTGVNVGTLTYVDPRVNARIAHVKACKRPPIDPSPAFDKPWPREQSRPMPRPVWTW